jgi:Na+/phosphate symporter
MPFANSLRRMFVIVKAMHKDAITAIRSRNSSLAADVTARDNDVDRLHWLIARQTHMILSNVSLSKKMGVSPVMAVHYFVISRIIERIGDHAERIVDNAKVILERDIDPSIMSMISKASELSIGIFDRSIISFFDNDMKNANRNIESLKALEAVCEEINNLVLQQETSDAIALCVYYGEYQESRGICSGYLRECDQLSGRRKTISEKGKSKYLN